MKTKISVTLTLKDWQAVVYELGLDADAQSKDCFRVTRANAKNLRRIAAKIERAVQS